MSKTEESIRTEFYQNEHTCLNRVKALRELLSEIIFRQVLCPALLSELNEAKVLMKLLSAEIRKLEISVQEAGHTLRV